MIHILARPVLSAIGLSTALGLIFSMIPPASAAGVPNIVRNINSAIVPQNSYPQFLGTLNGKTLFGAHDSSGAGLWSGDGTSSGTRLLKRFGGGYGEFQSPDRVNLVVIGSRGYFVADDGVTGLEVWTTDGTPGGTRLVKDIFPGANSSSVELLGNFGGRLIFVETDASGNRQIFSTNGVAGGTRQLTGFTGSNAGAMSEIIPADTKFYFVVEDEFYARTIWVSNGTRNGTHQIVTGLPPDTSGDASALYYPHNFRRVGDRILYMSYGLLWSLNIADDTVNAVTAVGGAAGFGPPSGVEWTEPVLMNGFILFVSDGFTPDVQELWRSDGTPAGTYAVATVANRNVDPNGIPYALLRRVGDRAVFLANDGVHGPQLWGTDGTSANTVALTNVALPGSIWDSALMPLATVGSLFYFASPDGTSATAWPLWQTNGTPLGTHKIPGLPLIDRSVVGTSSMTGNASTTFMTIPDGVNTTALLKYEPLIPRITTLHAGLNIDWYAGSVYDGNVLYFTNSDSLVGSEPWISIGTPAGTHLLKDIKPQTVDASSNPDEFANLNGPLVFAADDGVHGRELWVSNGADSGTSLFADVLPGPGSSNPNHLFALNNSLYFFATDSQGLSNFMVIPQVGAAPRRLASLQPTLINGEGVDCAPVALNGRVYFSANDGVNGYELWSSNGSPSGTHMVARIGSTFIGSTPCSLTVVGNRIYFTATGPAGNELWSSDGSALGTKQVADIAPGTSGSQIADITNVNGELYFRANDGIHGYELWKSDGTRGGTRLFVDLLPGADSSYAFPVGSLNQQILFGAYMPEKAGGSDWQLWQKAPGQAAKRINTGALSNGTPSVVYGSRAYFAVDGPTGSEPWVTDGTTAGTHLLIDINPTSTSSIVWFERMGSLTLFKVADSTLGDKLWSTDGTPGGTHLVSNMPPEPPGTLTPHIARHRLTVGQTFFFTGLDPAAGAELFGYTDLTLPLPLP